jgi:hypothetical protein
MPPASFEISSGGSKGFINQVGQHIAPAFIWRDRRYF